MTIHFTVTRSHLRRAGLLALTFWLGTVAQWLATYADCVR